jgi:hypothetical protein
MRIAALPSHLKRAALLLPLLAAGSLPAQAEIYTWKDANGVTHYSDVKPDTEKAKVLRAGTQRDLPGTAPSTPDAKPATAPTPADTEDAFRKRRAEAAEAQAKADKERRDAQTRKEACDAAQNQLTALRNGERVARYNSAGEKEVIDDAAREAEIARIQRSADAACK